MIIILWQKSRLKLKDHFRNLLRGDKKKTHYCLDIYNYVSMLKFII